MGAAMRLLIILFCMLLITHPASAEPGPFDLGANMVRDGFIGFIRAMGDESYSAAGVDGSQSSIDSYVALSTFTFDPFIFPKVIELNYISAIIAFLFILLYLGAGAAWAIICRVHPNMAMNIAEITDIDRDIAGRQYIKNIMTCIVVLLFAHVAIRLILIFNYILSGLVSKYASTSSIDISSNFLLFFISGIVFLFNVLFFSWRLVVICSVASFSLIVGAMLIWGYTQNIAISIIKYFIAVVFLQLIIVAVIAWGMIAIDVVRYFQIVLPGNLLATNLPLFISLAVLIMSLWVSFKICIPNTTISNIIVIRNALRRR